MSQTPPPETTQFIHEAAQIAHSPNSLAILLAYTEPEETLGILYGIAELQRASTTQRFDPDSESSALLHALLGSLYVICADSEAHAAMLGALAEACACPQDMLLSNVRCGNILAGSCTAALPDCFRQERSPGLLSLPGTETTASEPYNAVHDVLDLVDALHMLPRPNTPRLFWHADAGLTLRASQVGLQADPAYTSGGLLPGLVPFASGIPENNKSAEAMAEYHNHFPEHTINAVRYARFWQESIAPLQRRLLAALDFAAAKEWLIASGRKKDAALLTKSAMVASALYLELATCETATTPSILTANPARHAWELMREARCVCNFFHWEVEFPQLFLQADTPAGHVEHATVGCAQAVFHGIVLGASHRTPVELFPTSNAALPFISKDALAAAFGEHTPRLPKNRADVQHLRMLALAARALPDAPLRGLLQTESVCLPSFAWFRRALWASCPPEGIQPVDRQACNTGAAVSAAGSDSCAIHKNETEANEPTEAALWVHLRKKHDSSDERPKTARREQLLPLPVTFLSGKTGVLECRPSDLALVEPEQLYPPAGLKDEGDWKLLIKLYKAAQPLAGGWLRFEPGWDLRAPQLKALLREEFSPEALPFYEADMIAPYDCEYNAPAYWVDVRAQSRWSSRVPASGQAVTKGESVINHSMVKNGATPAASLPLLAMLPEPGITGLTGHSHHASGKPTAVPDSLAALPRLAVSTQNMAPAADILPQERLRFPVAALIPAGSFASAGLLVSSLPPSCGLLQLSQEEGLLRLLLAQTMLNSLPIAWLLAAQNRHSLSCKSIMRLPLPQPEGHALRKHEVREACRNALLMNCHFAPETFLPFGRYLDVTAKNVPASPGDVEKLLLRNEILAARLYGVTKGDVQRMRVRQDLVCGYEPLYRELEKALGSSAD